MITSFIHMDGYGFFIWLSFGVVFISCFLVYLKTRKTLKKYEKEFLAELETLPIDKKEEVLATSKVAKQVLAASLKTN
tara:strand:+ start:1138 stop:1371 length:234 start_codon:yes stop_codon:yes gene_type:complete